MARKRPPEKRYIAIDFDGTLSEKTDEPARPGPPLPNAKEAVQALRKRGHFVFVLTSNDADVVRSWLDQHGIEVDAINENPEVKTPSGQVKPYYDVLVDDRAVRFEGNWKQSLMPALNGEPWWKE